MPFNQVATGVLPTGVRYVVYRDSDGNSVAYVGGSASWRNNNPGNVTYGPFAANQGAIGADPLGRAIFPDAITGFNAVGNLITDPARYQGGNMTIHDMIYKYAPPSENPTDKYDRFLAQQLGVNTATTTINALSDAQREALVDSLRRFEGWNGGTQVAVGEGGDIATIYRDASVEFGVTPLVNVIFGETTAISGEEFDTLQTSSPIILDLDGDGVETTALADGAFFDHDGDVFREQTGWVKGNQDVLLALDRN